VSAGTNGDAATRHDPVIGGDTLDRSAAVVRPGGTLVSIAAPPRVQPSGARAMFFVVEPNRDQLAELARLVHQGRITPRVGAVRPLTETRDAFLHRQGGQGKTIVQVA
jgi:NADPH:quinone reductase-like Zn-dependent oxidoreductase